MPSLKGQPLGVQGLYGGGAGLNLYGQYQSDRVQAGFLSNQASSSRNFAGQLDEKADFDYLQAQRDKDRILAELTDIYLSAGVELEGAPMEALAETARQLALDNMITRRNTRQQANQARFEAALLNKQSDAAEKAADINLISGIAQSALPFFI